MLEFVKVTALYSNAVLTAILPHVSDFAQRAELRTNPIAAAEVRVFFCDPRKGEVGGHLYLTNGWGFWFKHGHVDRFETSSSYFSLQGPDRIPEFYGPVNTTAEEALAYGKRIILQLKGTAIDKLLVRPPKITGPIRLSDGFVPRYRIQWPRAGAGPDVPEYLNVEIDLEINASNKTVEMLALIASTNFFQPKPAVDVVPEPIVQAKPAPTSGGIRLNPVSVAYSNAFLQAVLPAFSEFAKKLELPISLPITPSMLKEGPITGIYENRGVVEAQIELTNGYMFRFNHGYVMSFALLYDTFYGFMNTNKYENLIGPVCMTQDEVRELGCNAIQKLGYTQKEIPAFGKKPLFVWDKSAGQADVFTRAYVCWYNDDDNPDHSDPPPPAIALEIDLSNKQIKSLSIREPLLWRDCPDIDLPVRP